MTQDDGQAARAIFGPQFEVISRYVDILLSDGIAHGLLGPREADRIWERHIVNCAAIGELVAPSLSVVDVGSGAGLPGLPLAILRPDLQVTLVEPMLRRTKFLTAAVEQLGLSERVRVVRARAEEMTGDRFDVVTSRALAPLDRLISWCEPLRRPTGEILALKGRSAAAEAASVTAALARRRLAAEVVRVRADPSAEATTVVRIRSAAG